MYTIVPHTEIIDHESKPGDPRPEIIDHRNEPKRTRWVKRNRKEQLPYDTLKKHRDVLLEEEIKYKKQIRELEKERDELVKTYENTYQENKKLKSIIDHGPDASKMKQLAKDKKEQSGIIERLEDENNVLNERLKELERLGDPLRKAIATKQWKDALDKARRIREAEDAIPTQGPFVGNKIFKKKRVAIDDDRLEETDAYDLQLDSIEKESQRLLTKIKQLKREKESIDYTMLMGKGALTRNAVVANAISEKLNRDLNKYAIRLEKIKLRHKRAKEFVQTVKNPTIVSSPEINEPDTQTPKTTKTYKASNVKRNQQPTNESSTENKSISSKNGVELPSLHNSTPSSPKVPFTKARKNVNMRKSNTKTAWSSKHFERPDTYTGIHQNSRQYSSEKLDKNSEFHTANLLADGHILNDDFRDDMRVQKDKHRIKTHSQGNPNTQTNGRGTNSKRSSVGSKFHDKISDNESITNRSEPLGNAKDWQIIATNKLDIAPANTSKTIAANAQSQRNTQHHTNGNNLHDQASERQNDDINFPILFKQAYNERRAQISPQPLKFNTDGRTIGGREAWQIVGNSGIRREQLLRYL